MTGTENRFEIEHALVIKAKNGDGRAFGRLMETYQDRILALAYDLMGNYADASDLAQEAFIRAFRSLGTFEERSRFSTWIYRITVNLSMDAHRRRKRRPTSSIEALFGEAPPGAEALVEMPSSALENEETHRFLDEALNRLTENQRTATMLKYFHHFSCREIAETMGCAEGTVRIHLHRALHHLRRRIKKREA